MVGLLLEARLIFKIKRPFPVIAIFRVLHLTRLAAVQIDFSALQFDSDSEVSAGPCPVIRFLTFVLTFPAQS